MFSPRATKASIVEKLIRNFEDGWLVRMTEEERVRYLGRQLNLAEAIQLRDKAERQRKLELELATLAQVKAAKANQAAV